MINGFAFASAGLRNTPLGGLHPAVRLGATVLALFSCMAAPAQVLALVALLLVFLLWWTGLDPVRQAAALKPWAGIALLVLVVHTFTTTAAAPLGRPSIAGVLAGGRALLRVGCSVGCLGLYLRITPLDDLVVGVRWWLRPLRRLGLDTDDLGLMMAVALGTAPVVLAEGRRIQAVVKLRKNAPAAAGDRPSPGRVKLFFQGLEDRAQVVAPLLESLVRRAEALTLSLRHRRPDPESAGPVPLFPLLVLGVWAAGLVYGMVRGGLGVPR